LFKLFQKWGRVKEVFISRRVNRWSRRFGFVRFFGVENVGSLEKALDRCYVGSKKLHVNLPRYRREEFVRNGGDALFGGTKARGGQSFYRRKSVEVWREKGGKAENVKGKAKQMYAEVVRTPTQDRWRGPNVTTKATILPWMTSSMVGRLKNEVNFEILQEECVKGGMSMFKARYMGDNIVLLSPKAKGRMEDIVKLNKEWFDCIFEDVKPWSESVVAKYKRVWVRCFGLPFHLWSKECLSKVVGEVATLVDIDDATLSWDCIEYARCQVRLLRSCKAEVSKDYRINGNVYKITIVEETTKHDGEDSGCMCECNHGGSSDSVTSLESFAEDSILSAKLSIEVGGQGGGSEGRPERSAEVGRGWSTNQRKKAPEKESSEGYEICQKEVERSYISKAKSVQGVLAEKTDMTPIQHVSDACNAIHMSLVNIIDAVATLSSTSRPNYIEAQTKECSS